MQKKNIRNDVFHALIQAENGKLPKINRHNLPREDVGLFKELCLGVIRHKLFLDHVIDQFLKKKPSKNLRTILRIGAYQLLFLDKIPLHAILFETVQLAKAQSEKNFVNAVLRKISAQPKKTFFNKPKTLQDISTYYSIPLWMAEKWQRLLGFDLTETTCEISNCVAPLSLRINTLKTESLETEKQIKTLFGGASEGVLVEHSYNAPSNTSFSTTREFKEGHFVIQNEASQMVAWVLDPQPYESILDACAHPGVKTSHIAALMKNMGDIYCLDKKKPSLFHDNMERLGITIAHYHTHDLLKPLQLKKTFDRVLLDAPCSCWGVLRKHPEIKWRQSEKDLNHLQTTQKTMRDHLLPHLKNGGVFVYSVCTFSQEETLDFIEDTLKKYPDLSLENLEPFFPERVKKFIHKSGYFMCTPQKDGLDGFFICRFLKKISA